MESSAPTMADAPSHPPTVHRTRKASRAQFLDWMGDIAVPTARAKKAGRSLSPTLTRTSTQHGRVSPTPAEQNVASVVARLAFSELDEDHVGMLSRDMLLRAFKHDERFRELMLPLLSLPGFAAISVAADPNLRWNALMEAVDADSHAQSADGQPGEADDEDFVSYCQRLESQSALHVPMLDGVGLETFVAFFDGLSRSSMKTLSPRRPSPRRTKNAAAEHSVRKRVDPNAEPPLMWDLPTARGTEPITHRTLASLTCSRSLPSLHLHPHVIQSPLARSSPPPDASNQLNLPSIDDRDHRVRGRLSPSHGRISPSPMSRVWR